MNSWADRLRHLLEYFQIGVRTTPTIKTALDFNNKQNAFNSSLSLTGSQDQNLRIPDIHIQRAILQKTAIKNAEEIVDKTFCWQSMKSRREVNERFIIASVKYFLGFVHLRHLLKLHFLLCMWKDILTTGYAGCLYHLSDLLLFHIAAYKMPCVNCISLELHCVNN